MNLLLVTEDEVDDQERVRLEGRRARHLRKVLRVTPGRQLRAGVVRGPRATAEVEQVSVETVIVRLTRHETPPPPPPGRHLVVALPRPQVLHRVLQFAAAMDIARIDLIATGRVEKSFFQSPSITPQRIARELRLGAEQGATTWVPEVAVHPRFSSFLTTLQTRALPPLLLLAHPDGGVPLERACTAAPGLGDWVVAIGPEGGWLPTEVASWQSAGFAPVDLGPWILRVEAAVVSIISQLALLARLRETEPSTTHHAGW